VAYLCRNHPTVETEYLCAGCEQPFCEACSVELLGQRYCAPCRDVKVRQMEGFLPPGSPGDGIFAGTGQVDIGRWLRAGWATIQSDLGAFALGALLSGLISLLTCGILTGPMQCGLLMMAYRRMRSGRVEASNVFDGFRRALWAILAAILVGAIGFVAGFVAELPLTIVQIVANVNKNEALAALAGILNWPISIVVSALVSGVMFFVLPHVAARNVNPIDAISASWQVFRRNPVMFSIAGLVFGLVTSLGALACLVGALITVPLVAAAQARAYADHFGLEGFDEPGFAVGYAPAPYAAPPPTYTPPTYAPPAAAAPVYPPPVETPAAAPATPTPAEPSAGPEVTQPVAPPPVQEVTQAVETAPAAESPWAATPPAGQAGPASPPEAPAPGAATPPAAAEGTGEEGGPGTPPERPA